MSRLIRQGDVMLTQVDALPPGAVKMDGPVIVAYGEVTGHCHKIEAGADMFQLVDGRRFVVCGQDTEVVHDEHDPLTLMSGVYEVGIQREYSPEAIRNVSD